MQVLGNLVYSVCGKCVFPHPVCCRVVYVFGPPVKEPPTDVTPTFLTTGVLSTLRQADFEAHNILRESGRCSTLPQGSDSWLQIPANLMGVIRVVLSKSTNKYLQKKSSVNGMTVKSCGSR